MAEDRRPTPPYKGRDTFEEETLRDIYARLFTREELEEIMREILREEGLI